MYFHENPLRQDEEVIVDCFYTIYKLDPKYKNNILKILQSMNNVSYFLGQNTPKHLEEIAWSYFPKFLKDNWLLFHDEWCYTDKHIEKTSCKFCILWADFCCKMCRYRVARSVFIHALFTM